MKVAVLGAGGQLAFDLVRIMTGWDLVPLRHDDLDVCEFTRVRKMLLDIKPSVVINTAAFHRVDECEDKPEETFRVNALGALNVARTCDEIAAICVYISTDYVFDGSSKEPYIEKDRPHPLNVYGASKLAGEQLVQLSCSRYFIVRSSGLYGVVGPSGKGANFVETMIRLAREKKPIRVVNDQIFSPTYTKDLAQKIKELITTDAYGLYHITNSSACTWYEFAKGIFEILGLKPDLTPTTSASYGLKARRPAYSVLGGHMLKLMGLNGLRSWQEALAAYLRERSEMGSLTTR